MLLPAAYGCSCTVPDTGVLTGACCLLHVDGCAEHCGGFGELGLAGVKVAQRSALALLPPRVAKWRSLHRLLREKVWRECCRHHRKCAAACVLLAVCCWLCAGCCKCGVCVRYQRGSRSLTMNLQAATGESEQPVAAEAVDEDEDEEEEELEFGDEVIIQLRKSQSAAAAVYRL